MSNEKVKFFKKSFPGENDIPNRNILIDLHYKNHFFLLLKNVTINPYSHDSGEG